MDAAPREKIDMDFGYSQEQEALRDDVRRFIDEHLTEEVQDEIENWGEGGRGPLVRELYKIIAERGWVGITWPKNRAVLSPSPEAAEVEES